jgi:hypothetical protein
MTPSDIEVLLHFNISNEPHPRETAPAVAHTIHWFINVNVIVAKGGGMFDLTERGRKLLQMLCDTPLPEHAWTDPREQKE